MRNAMTIPTIALLVLFAVLPPAWPYGGGGGGSSCEECADLKQKVEDYRRTAGK